MYRTLYHFFPGEAISRSVQSSLILFAGLLMLLLGVAYIVFVFLARRKQNRLILDNALAKEQFEKELITTEFEVQEQTRKKLATELHDNIGQLLSLTHVTLASVTPGKEEKTLMKVASATELVGRSIQELRQLSRLIHGEQLVRQGIVASIEQEITWLERTGQYSIHFKNRTKTLAAHPETELFLYRVFQEAISNLLRHSGADQIDIALDWDEDLLQLTVSDNGKGFDTSKDSRGLGLQSMQKRISMLSGTMQIRSAPGQGTSLIFSIPFLSPNN
jgi:signal transduction histidine kinase